MTTALATTSPETTLITYTKDQVDLIKRTICQGSTNDEFQLFMYQARKTGLDPLAKQIYAIKRWDSHANRNVMGIQTSIDGFRLVAERSGKYSGQDGPYWCGQDGVWSDVWLTKEPPVSAKIGVLRSDFEAPCWGVARFDAYAQRKKGGGVTHMWANMGDVMIAKCAEALALRKAFPQELSGLYTSDEMQQSIKSDDNITKTEGAEPTKTEQKDEWCGPLTKETLTQALTDLVTELKKLTCKDTLGFLDRMFKDNETILEQAKQDVPRWYAQTLKAKKEAEIKIGSFPGDEDPFDLPPIEGDFTK